MLISSQGPHRTDQFLATDQSDLHFSSLNLREVFEDSKQVLRLILHKNYLDLQSTQHFEPPMEPSFSLFRVKKLEIVVSDKFKAQLVVCCSLIKRFLKMECALK